MSFRDGALWRAAFVCALNFAGVYWRGKWQSKVWFSDSIPELCTSMEG